MAKFYGIVGYAAQSVETEPGLYEDQIVERRYIGDVVRNTRRLVEGSEVNNDLTVETSISILADPYALDHFHTMKYVEWSGARWIVSSVNPQRPRLILRLGGVYNGPRPAAGSSAETSPDSHGDSGQ